MKSHYSIQSILNYKSLLVLALFLSVLLFPSRASATISPSSIVEMTNKERVALGLDVLSENSALTTAAQAKANDMAARGYFSHNTPDGRTPWQFMDEAGYKYSSAGENLAVDYIDNAILVNAWMNSPGHRANIVNGAYQEIGVASARGVYQGRDTIFVVQMFGVPKTSVAPTIVEKVNVPTIQSVKSEVLVVTAPAKIENTPAPIVPIVVEVKENTQKETVATSVNQPIKSQVSAAAAPTEKKKPSIQIAKAETNDVLGTKAEKIGATTEVQKESDVTAPTGSTTPALQKEIPSFIQIVEVLVNKIIKIVDSFLATVLVAKN